jgi:hypothetical protein
MIPLILMLLSGATQDFRAEIVCYTAVYDTPKLSHVKKTSPRAYAVCLDIARAALDRGLSPIPYVALGLHETGWQDVPCNKGQWRMAHKGTARHELPSWCEQGPMQVKPKWHCPGRVASEDCPYLDKGVELLARLYEKSNKDWMMAFAMYKHPTQPDGQYAIKVNTHRRRIDFQLRRRRLHKYL